MKVNLLRGENIHLKTEEIATLLHEVQMKWEINILNNSEICDTDNSTSSELLVLVWLLVFYVLGIKPGYVSVYSLI